MRILFKFLSLPHSLLMQLVLNSLSFSIARNQSKEKKVKRLKDLPLNFTQFSFSKLPITTRLSSPVKRQTYFVAFRASLSISRIHLRRFSFFLVCRFWSRKEMIILRKISHHRKGFGARNIDHVFHIEKGRDPQI